MDNLRAKALPAGLLWLRVLTGLGIAAHGYQKLFGGMMPGFTAGVTALGFPLPHLFAYLAAGTEFFGGILIALGLFTRLAALFLFINMSVAAFLAHGGDPLDKKELALAYWTAAGAVGLLGAGPYALDAVFFGRKSSGPTG